MKNIVGHSSLDADVDQIDALCNEEASALYVDAQYLCSF